MSFSVNTATWVLSALTVAGVIFRPMRVPEWVFAAGGAVLLVGLGLLPWREALHGVEEGGDVYMFLAGMMLLAETARREGLFDTLAAHAARMAKGSPHRLFTLIFLIGTLVTVFLSNDATAVVLTPAVIAVTRAARVSSPIPYLLICAFVANAASFVLPISNPANLVVFGQDMPALQDWLARFSLPSVLALAATFFVLRWTQDADLKGRTSTDIAIPRLSAGGRIAAFGLVAAAFVLLGCSALGLSLGLPTLAAGLLTGFAVMLAERSSPLPLIKEISWDTLVLVAGLFVIVRALELSGLQTVLVQALQEPLNDAPRVGALLAGAVVAFGTNLTNNLPLGLLAGAFTTAADLPQRVVDGILIGVNLGPNLSVTGSLATILWLTALRRQGLSFSTWRFLKLGFVVMPPALLLALMAVVFQP
ncbi:arsenic transporter [Tianweitania sp. BSSL-BM11]|uniref:Arsenic transporter n=1 Tax=Tianweitania aestuarii TaxID=2814886 RepID=A0ABS5RZ01_9HYPH|nr:arsenic transporter [Tianweitania aestuarii]MBS9722000.1 arsenic transporter [Tianweitania aestuarii]